VTGWWWTIVALTAHLGPGEDDQWARVLTELDLQRTVALEAADPELLTGIYASPAAAADDADLIAAYTQRGGRIDGAVLVITDLQVRRADRNEAVLEVVDQLAPAVVRWDDGSTSSLPHDDRSRRVVTLRMTDDGWRISSVRQSAQH